MATTRESLARELQQETVRIISEGLLFSRALESVIGELRVNKQTQQAGGAYQPPPLPNEFPDAV